MPKAKKTTKKKKTVRKKTKPYPKSEQQKHFEGLLDYIGPLNVSPAKYAREYNLNKRTVELWKTKWYDAHGEEWLKRFAVGAAKQATTALHLIARGMSQATTAKEQADAAIKYLGALKLYNEALGKTSFRLYKQQEEQQTVINSERTVLTTIPEELQQKLLDAINDEKT